MSGTGTVDRASWRRQSRADAGLPTGGEWGGIVRAASGVVLDDTEELVDDLNHADVYHADVYHADVYHAAGHVMGTAPARITAAAWWERAETLTERNHDDGDYVRMSKVANGGVEPIKARRMLYAGNGTQLRMPSASAIRRFSKDNDDQTFDVPFEVAGLDGAVAGWARVTRHGAKWHVTALGEFGDDADNELSLRATEAVTAVLEGRRAKTALTDAGDLITRARRRNIGTVTTTPVQSEWIQAVGYNPAAGVMVVEMTGDRQYAYTATRQIYERFVESESIGSAYNSFVRRVQQNIAVERCADCGRFIAGGTDHRCELGHNSRPGRPAPVIADLPVVSSLVNDMPPPALRPVSDRAAERIARRRGMFDDILTGGTDAQVAQVPVDGRNFSGEVNFDDEHTVGLVMEIAAKAARFHANRLGVPHEEVEGNVLASLTVRATNARTGVSKPFVIDPATGSLNTYIGTVAKQAALRLRNNGGTEITQVGRSVAEAVSAEELRKGRSLTVAERNAVVDRIIGARTEDPVEQSALRAELARRRTGDHSIDARRGSSDSDGVSLADTIRSTPQLDTVADLARRMRAEAAWDTAGGMIDARTRAWPAYAAANEWVPPVPRESISTSRATKHRDFVESVGGIGGLLSSWQRNEATPEQEAVIFAPWGADLTEERKTELVRAMASMGSTRAHTLWRSALTTATRLTNRQREVREAVSV